MKGANAFDGDKVKHRDASTSKCNFIMIIVAVDVIVVVVVIC